MKLIKPLLIALFMTSQFSQFNITMASATDNDQEGVTAGIDVLSVTGEVLTPIEPSNLSLTNLAQARVAFEENPSDPDLNIWFGRRMAYTGNYHDAIRIFSDGIEKFPNDPRFYRHRGHRYISIRQFDHAIEDLKQAARLMEKQPNQIEPDGLPNSQNIPLTTTQGNIWYHLGLAYYLKQDWPNALDAFRKGYNLGGNDDNLVSTGHWIYMILRLMRDEAEAVKALNDIHSEMNIIENMSYHQLCLLYKGDIKIDDMMPADGDSPSSAAVAYGLANYFYYNGDKSRSDKLLQSIVAGSSWSAFGFIAAEVDLANKKR